MNYNEWKENYENELANYRENNVKIVYDYQEDYDYYCNSPNWVMHGDFNQFIKRGSEVIPQRITAKYEEYLINDINLFEEFVNDEINKLYPLFDIDNMLNQIFKFNGFKNLSPETLTEEQSVIFENAKKAYKIDNAEMIKKLQKHSKSAIGDDLDD